MMMYRLSQDMLSRRKLIASFVLVVMGGLKMAHGQETPFFKTPDYETNVSHRHTFCRLHRELVNGTLDRRDALSGMNLNVALFENQINNETGAIDEIRPDIAIQVFDEVAKRGNFTWRNTYGVMKTPSGNETNDYDTAVVWATVTYDLLLEWYLRTPERLLRGILFPEQWFDGSLIIIKKKLTMDDDAFSFFNFATPFKTETWALLLLTIAASGLIYFGLDYIDSLQYAQGCDTTLVGSIFLTFNAMIGQVDQKPKSSATRLTVMSTAILSLLFVSAYTANLASFLVTKNTPLNEITSLEDAVVRKKKICVWKGTASDKILRDLYPKYKNIDPLNIEEEIFTGVAEGKCDIAFTSLDTWKNHQNVQKINKKCTLEWVGRVVKFLPASFTLADSDKLCSAVLRSVVNLHLTDMKLDGTLDNIWEKYRKKDETSQCDSSDAGDETEHMSLSLKNMGGIVGFHACFLLVAVLLSMWGVFNDPRFKKSTVKGYFSSLHIQKKEKEKESAKASESSNRWSSVQTPSLKNINESIDNYIVEENPVSLESIFNEVTNISKQLTLLKMSVAEMKNEEE